ncbi:hypothetical protein PENTCL1PPCAC_30793 [Pristionchus entomophagus]|uniref:G protein-coupled receptor n=1 Tax=Pristionchus entomophagus TaxID=358040 RepID=A0AAV5US40_9BILA|nr:hypothetical protein PENTCL1PPCAC_30793 [Pristionchus entomophagus]
MTTPYNLSIPSLGVNVQLTYLSRRINDIAPNSLFYFLTILNYVIEMICMMVLTIILLPAIITFWKTAKLHKNLKRVTVAFFCHIALYLLLRYLIFLYQIRLFTPTGNFSLDFPYVIAHFVRVYHVYSLYSVMMAFVLERSAATVFVSDYEVKRRFYISRCLICYISAVSLIIPVFTVATSEGKTGNLLGHFVMGSQLIGSNAIITVIWIRNIRLKRRLKMSIDPNLLTTEYTIGKKYQVQENLKSFKVIRNMVGSAIPLGATSLTIATYNLGKPQELQSFLGPTWIC